MKYSNFYTHSIEEALSPFILQVESLINLRHINSYRQLSQYSLCKACENVNVAVISFITTAENIASNYPQVTNEIRNSCNWSRSLVTKILDNTLYGGGTTSNISTTSINHTNNNSPYKGFHSLSKVPNTSRRSNNSHDDLNDDHDDEVDESLTNPRYHSLDKNLIASTSNNQIIASGQLLKHSNATFSQFAEGLMRSIERILLVADWIVVLDVRRAIVKVIQSLGELDTRGGESFPIFMHMFSRFGADMVELGEISGQRQGDLKNSQLRCLVALVRSMLERTTMMILAVWKINFRHDSRATRGLRSLTFQHASHLLDLLTALLVVSHPLYKELSRSSLQHSDGPANGPSQPPGPTSVNLDFLEKEGENLYEKLFGKQQPQNQRQNQSASSQLADSPYIWQILLQLKSLVNVDESRKKSSTNSSDDEIDDVTAIQYKNDEAVSLVTDLLSAGQHFTQASFIELSERQQIISLCRRLRVQLRSCLDNQNNEASTGVNGNAQISSNDKLGQSDDIRLAPTQNNVAIANRNITQARLFVEDLCDQILASIFNLTLKYGEDIIANSIKLSQDKEFMQPQISVYGSANNKQNSDQRSGSFKRTRNLSNSNSNYASDDRKPPKPGESLPNNRDDDKSDRGQFSAEFEHLEDNPGILGNSLTHNLEMSTKNIENLKLKLMSVCSFLAQISMSKEISLVCVLTRNFVETLSQMINLALQIYQEISTSKHAKDCLDVLLDVWATIVSDISNIMNDVSEWRDHQYSHQHKPALVNCSKPNKTTPNFNFNSISSSDIMRQYQQRHINTINTNNTNNNNNQFTFLPRSTTPLAMSAPNSPAIPVINSNLNPGRSQSRGPTNSNSVRSRQMHNSSSINSLDKERRSNMNVSAFGASANQPMEIMDSPNPWLSVSEIERIIFMKGRVVIDLASQITMFSHNEGPLKTSVELMGSVQQLVRELTNFHGFAERNIISDQMLPDLDRFPTLISSIYSVLSMPVTSRQEMFTKIDRIVEMARFSSTVITTIMASWRSQSTALTKPTRSQSINRVQAMASPPINFTQQQFRQPINMNYGNTITRFPFDDNNSTVFSLDAKSCYSDSAYIGRGLRNIGHSLARTSSLKRAENESNNI